MSVDNLYVDDMSVDDLYVDNISVDDLSVDDLYVDDLSVYDLSVGYFRPEAWNTVKLGSSFGRGPPVSH